MKNEIYDTYPEGLKLLANGLLEDTVSDEEKMKMISQIINCLAGR